MTVSPRTWRLDLPGYDRPPLSLNDRANRWKAQRIRNDLMEDVHKLAIAHRLPRGLDRVGIVLWWQVKTRHRRDEDNMAPSLKAACDALSSGTRNHPGYGLVVDDDYEHVTSGTAICYTPGEPPRMWLEITELDLSRETDTE